MDGDSAFRVPSSIPQDLQLIQDLIGDLVPIPSSAKPVILAQTLQKSDDGGEGSDSDADSEQEVEADILGALDDEVEEASGYAQFTQVSVY